MSANRIASRCRKTLVAAGLAVILPVSGLGADNAPPEALNVKVFPDRYVAAGKRFSDLAALEAWAKPIQIRVIWLDSCSPASTKQLLAAVERFHSVYADGIQIRTLSPGEAGCVTAARLTSWVQAGTGLARADVEYYATDEFGRSTLP